jgi:hypothetical protein
MNDRGLIRLVGAVLVVTVLVVTIAPSIDLDPSALSSQRNAHLIFLTMTTMPQVIVALLPDHSGLDSPLTEIVARIPGLSEIATSLLC